MRRITETASDGTTGAMSKAIKGRLRLRAERRHSCLRVASILLVLLCLMSIWPGSAIFLEKTGQVFGC